MAGAVDDMEIVRGVFETVKREFAEFDSHLLECPRPEVSLELAFDDQPELAFPVVATLQDDELCLSAGGSFVYTWFPCSDPAVVDQFRDCLAGVLSGRLRLVEFARGSQVIKARLEEHSSGRWRTKANWGQLSWPSPWKAEVRVYQNRPSRSKGE